jgi:hypothetical protein
MSLGVIKKTPEAHKVTCLLAIFPFLCQLSSQFLAFQFQLPSLRRVISQRCPSMGEFGYSSICFRINSELGHLDSLHGGSLVTFAEPSEEFVQAWLEKSESEE